jgi:methyl coenzyme M reductase beta subunit
MASRIIVRIELTPSAKEALNDLTDKAGMTQVALLSRLVEWFSHQSDMIQAAVLGQYPSEIEADIAKMILKRMASGKKED